MTSFDERENAFEAKFAHDSELQFKAEARRNKIVAHWAAGLLGKTDDEIRQQLEIAMLEAKRQIAAAT